MNRYASLAQRHWETHRPDELAGMNDQERFFAQLGEQIGYQVSERARELQGSAPPGEQYLAKVSRLNRARVAAEQQVLAETLPAPE